MEIREFIKKKRKDKGLSQRALSILVGISHTEVSRIESGERVTSATSILLSMADALDVSREEMLTVAGYIDKDLPVIQEVFPALKKKEELDVIEKIADILKRNPNLSEKEYSKIVEQVQMVINYSKFKS